MPNPFGKSRDMSKPYAIYTGPMGFEWRILKTYKLAKNEDTYARWQVAARSEATFGSFELGDAYAIDVKEYGRLVAAEPEWLATYGNALQSEYGLPTPAEYLDQLAEA